MLEEQLCDRVALILLRLDRVARFEAAVATRTAAAIAGDSVAPDTVTCDGIDICRPPHPTSPPANRLAYARARVAGCAPFRDAFRTAAAALAGELQPDATIPGATVWKVVNQVGEVFGWDRDLVRERWAAAFSPDDAIAGAAFRSAACALAAAAGEPDEVVTALRNHLIACAAEYDGPLAEKEAEVEKLATQMRGAGAGGGGRGVRGREGGGHRGAVEGTPDAPTRSGPGSPESIAGQPLGR